MLPRLVSVLLALNIASVIGQQQLPSLGEVAAREEQRRKSLTEPSTVYTIIEPRRFDRERLLTADPLSSCQSEEKQDTQSGNRFTILRCPDGTTTEIGSNARNGTNWRNKYLPDGSMEGTDSCGNNWLYDAATTLYVNENGERRIGVGEFRKRLESPAPCEQRNAATSEPDWRKRFKEADEGLNRAEVFQEALQTRINVLTADFVNRDDPEQRAIVAVERQKALAELERVKGEIEGYRKVIYDIEEEARRAGAMVVRVSPPTGMVRSPMQPGSLMEAARAIARQRCLALMDENARKACVEEAEQK